MQEASYSRNSRGHRLGFAADDPRSLQFFWTAAEKDDVRLNNFRAQDAANIVWAFAVDYLRGLVLFEAASVRIEDELEAALPVPVFGLLPLPS